MTAVQQSYEINPDRGYQGSLARPTEPHATGSGILRNSGSYKARPGDPLWYDRSNNAFSYPTTDVQFQQVCAILGYRADTVANPEDIVEFDTGDEIQFFTFGTVWVEVSQAAEYGDRLHWNFSNREWLVDNSVIDALANADFTGVTGLDLTDGIGSVAEGVIFANIIVDQVKEISRYPVVCVSREPVAANGLAMAQIGYGRVG